MALNIVMRMLLASKYTSEKAKLRKLGKGSVEVRETMQIGAGLEQEESAKKARTKQGSSGDEQRSIAKSVRSSRAGRCGHQ